MAYLGQDHDCCQEWLELRLTRERRLSLGRQKYLPAITRLLHAPICIEANQLTLRVRFCGMRPGGTAFWSGPSKASNDGRELINAIPRDYPIGNVEAITMLQDSLLDGTCIAD